MNNSQELYRPEMATQIPKQETHILDVGCNNGSFIQSILSINPKNEAWGIEPDFELAEKCKKVAHKVINKSVEDAIEDLPDGYFDRIFFNDVLEHLMDPETVLREIKKKLKPGGCVVSSIPNVRYFRVLRDLLFRKEWVYVDSGVLAKVHLRFFTEKSIVRLYKDAGYKVEQHYGINTTTSFRPYIYYLMTFGYFGLDSRHLQFLTMASSSSAR